MTTTGNMGFDAFVDAIAERVCQRLREANEPEYLDAKEVARRLSRPLRSVHQMAKVGTIPSRRDGRRVLRAWPREPVG